VTAATTTTTRDPGPWLWAVTGVAWLVTLVLMVVPAAMGTMPSMAAADLAAPDRPGAAPVATVAVFALGWIVMVAAMMLPTTVPMARLVVVVTSDVPDRRRVLATFAGAYAAVWTAAGLVGLGAATLLARAAAGVPGHLVLAGALALAGAFQFSPLKKRCLTRCRDPRAVLFTRYRPGAGGAWSLALRHALDCLGCCWALMAVMFAVGSGGLVWMLGLTAVMVAEKNAPWGRRLVAPLGVALLVAAVLLVGLAVAAPAPMPHHM
jgi:predicted metal-binding membrane protein